MNISLKTIGVALPGRDLPGMEVSNQLLSDCLSEFSSRSGLEFPLPDPQFAWDRVGILSRRFLDQSLDTYDMALVAARQAMAQSDIPRENFRVVIVSSVTSSGPVPPMAALLQADLDLSHEIIAFDLPAGCNGYLSGLALVRQLLQSQPEGSAALLVTSEAMSRVLQASDRQSCVIFGDAAAASILQRDSRPGLSQVSWWTLGNKGPLIRIAPGPGPTYRFRVQDQSLHISPDSDSSLRVTMNGRQVFRDMVLDLPERIQQELQRRGRRLEDFQWVAFHQANRRILEAVATRLELPPERILGNIEDLGNTTSASIPLLLSSLRQTSPGPPQSILLVGFGTGYSLGLAEVLF